MQSGMPADGRPAFHAGEVAIQKSLGVPEAIAERGRRLIRDYLPDQHRDFYSQLRFINLGVMDGHDRPWAILRTGEPGFVSSPDEKTLEITSLPLPGEPGDLALAPGVKIGIVGVQLETRRRNRVNGTLVETSPDHMVLKVDQSIGNCARYIQKRGVLPSSPSITTAAARTSSSTELQPADVALIERSDTLFIASRARALTDDPRAGLDVNHRGGAPGFVEVRDAQTLLIPDYRGNNFYNTLGNIQLDSRTGLQFLDFETGDILNLTGHAEIVLPEDDTAEQHGTGVCISFTPDHVLRTARALPFRFSFIEYWPKLPSLDR